MARPMKPKPLRRKKSAEEIRLLDIIQERQIERRRQKKLAAVPEVGVFFMVGEHIHGETTPITEAGAYGKFLIHEDGHIGFWPKLQQAGVVPMSMEYDECPRGRVTWDAEEGKARLFLDPCILKRTELVQKIMRSFNLPQGTAPETDRHYRCPRCMRREGGQ